MMSDQLELAKIARCYQDVRALSESLCRSLSPDDYNLQSMPEASPPKWHLGHTTWFFETFLLRTFDSAYWPLCEEYTYIFNSYYDAVGARHPRAHRGLIARPTIDEVYDYRRHIDRRVLEILSACQRGAERELLLILTIGLQHEQQHQELLLTDLKHAWSHNRIAPVFRQQQPSRSQPAADLKWHAVPGGIHEIGHKDRGFAFDNESPRHQVLLRPFSLASRLVTCGEYLEFMASGGYHRPELWLSDGWATVRSQGWMSPLYWAEQGGAWTHFTLGGIRPLEASEPVTHVSYYEADAYCRWLGVRLPTEAEWEVVAASQPVAGHFLDEGVPHPEPATGSGELQQLFGDAWEWTSSPYTAYPGYRPAEGALGEYNGKFMCNQMVLRGGSCASPPGHLRASYRNFFPPEARWQFSGIRPARDL